VTCSVTLEFKYSSDSHTPYHKGFKKHFHGSSGFPILDLCHVLEIEQILQSVNNTIIVYV